MKVSELIKGMTPKLNPGEYVFVTLKDIDGDTAEDFARQNKHNLVAEFILNSTKGKK